MDWSNLHIPLFRGRHFESLPCLHYDSIRRYLRRELIPNHLHRNTPASPHLPYFRQIRHVHATVYHELHARRNLSRHGYRTVA